MTDHPEAVIRRRVQICRDRRGIAEVDAEAVLDAHRNMELTVVSDQHHSDVLMRAVKFGRELEGGVLASALEDRDAAETIVRWINRNYDNPESNRSYRQSLRAFGRHALGVEDLPECLDWVPAGYPSNYDPAPDPGKMLHWDEHVKPMIDACMNVRDEALIALCWDLGARTSELYELQVSDISDSEYGLKVSIENGKNGSRSPTIVKSVPFVRDWIEHHPGERDDYLWTKLSSSDRISRNMLRKALYEAGERADVTLPSKPTPTQFRKSSASYLASQNVNQAFLEDHHGWVTGSDKAARYITVFSDQSDKAIAAAHGVDIEPDDDGLEMIECVRCSELNDKGRLRCYACDHALSQEAVEKEQLLDRFQNRLDERMLESDDRETRAEILSGKRQISDVRSELELHDLHQLLSSNDA